ncbi:Transcription elongation factor SPT5 [Aphelenchoides avenae]|nr:Transcription elongation factor SPT5 [Aphelenchus avenae]
MPNVQGANNDAYFRGTCTRSIPRKYLLPVRPNVGDAARIIYGEDVGLRGNVISLDGPEAVLKMDSGVRLIPLNFLCKVA